MKKLKIQDVISVGIYTTIYFLIVFLCMMGLRFTIPAFNSILIPGVTALFAGIVYLLMLNRVPRFGAITIMGSVMGLFFLVSGHFPLSFVPNIICAVLADLIQYKTAINKKLRTYLSYIVFSYGLTGPVLPLWFMKNAYVDSLVARGKDAAYIESVFAPVTTFSFYLCIFSVIIGGIAGMMLGRTLYNKHFSKVEDRSYDSTASEF
ncbi:MptD family putative ECF transporter S component [Enterococcus sp. BWM-S5]|uniref:MptD family putative ECF transporter S component n=1 Tax=Enterococcus larvae TaxID=2794352 RepID=A0ABS4CHJ0_9ENTE|nr:MptD family putative ECF transporter S component [Enterococcus larvae]MBP1046098.1 MptD family putative ECF transporter S component [Enterococcus larvae]